jgi:ERCC4-related helicase
MSARDILDRHAEAAGWDESELLDLLCEYVDNQGSEDALEDFFAMRAEEAAETAAEVKRAKELVRSLPRERCVALLESISIACYEHETVEELREAVLSNVADGDLNADSLVEAP